MHIFTNTTSTGTCTRGSIRLYNGTSTLATNKSHGMLQMCDSKGRWTAVCDYRWGCSISKVACRQLGFSGNSKYDSIGSCILHKSVGVHFEENAGPWPIIGFGPYGDCGSSNLTNCYSYSNYYRIDVYYCNPLSDNVFLQCETTQTGEYHYK